MFTAKETVIKIGNTCMNCITFGSGRKTLIMIQGLSTRSIKGSALPLAMMYRIFSKQYKVYLFDRRENIKENITIRDLSLDIAKAMDSLGIKQADIFGVSQGGMIAQVLAIQRPDLVNKLVLAVTASRNNDTLVHAVNKWIDLIRAQKYDELTEDMAEKLYSAKYLRKYRPLLPLLAKWQTPKDPERFIALAKSCLTCYAYNELEKIKCPVLVIGGGLDKVVGAAASQEIAAKLGCRIIMYDDLGHAVYEEAKDFNRKVYDFLIS